MSEERVQIPDTVVTRTEPIVARTEPVVAQKRPRRKYVQVGRTPEQKLADLKAIREAADGRRRALDEARAERIKAARQAAKRAQKALNAEVLKASRAPDPDDTPDRKALRKAERQAKGKAKGMIKLPGRQRAGSIDAMDVALILALKEKEASNREIAKALNIGSDTVARVLVEFADTRSTAKAYLKNKAEQIAHDAVKASSIAADAGKAEASLELLDRLDVAPKRMETTDHNKTLIIVGSSNTNALPTFPSLPAFPLIDATT